MSSTEPNVKQDKQGNQPLPDEFYENWANIRMGQEALGLENAQRNMRRVEVIARNAATGDIGNMKGWPGEGEDNDMGVSIGNKFEVHNHPAIEQKETPPPVQKETTASNPSSGLSKKGLAAALLAAALAGGGTTVGVPWLAGLFQSEPVSQSTPPSFDDMVSEVEAVQLYRGEPYGREEDAKDR